MSVLKFKDLEGNWIDIPTIKGTDGAIQYTAGAGITIEDNVISATAVELTGEYDDNGDIDIKLLDEYGKTVSKTTIPVCKETHYVWDKTAGDTAKELFQKVYNAYINENKILNVDLADGNKRYKLTSVSTPDLTNEVWCNFMDIPIITNNVDFVFIQSISAVLTVAGGLVTAVEVKEFVDKFKLVREFDGKNGALPTNNTFAYTPTSDYEPATKLYVDETHYKHYPNYSASKTQALKNINGVIQWVNE